MDRILIIEADRAYSENFSGLLEEHGYSADCAVCGSDASARIQSEQYGLIVVDISTPGVNSEYLSQLKSNYPYISILVITENENTEAAIGALKHGAYAYILKPVNSDEFLHSVAHCFEQHKMQYENEQLKKRLNLLQSSQAIAGCLETDRIYHMVLDAVAKEVGVHRCMGLFQSEQALETLQIRGITPEIAAHFKGVIQTHITKGVAENTFMAHIGDVSATAPAIKDTGIEEACLIFMRNNSGLLQGVIVLLNDPGLSLPDFNARKENVLFLLDQSLRAFENARNYSLAKDMLFIDDLSGLYNYRYLEIALDRELKRIERYSSQLAILFLDLDAFKLVNDTHGHLVGSHVLKEVGMLLKSSVRDVDVVIRYGGDEYTIILVETNPDAAGIVAERVRKQIASHSFLADIGLNIRLTCSIGYSCCPEDTISKHDLLEMADTAMYAGKSSGKNCVIRHKKLS